MTGLRWCRRTTVTIAEELSRFGIAVSPNTVARLLHQMGYSLRVNAKNIATESSPDRNLQFEYLTELRCQFQRLHLPIISVDTKKRELVGNFKNPGRRWEKEERRVFDHDFRTDSMGVAIPYGIYDVQDNRGALIVGVSHDTPAFAAHSIAHWWGSEGSCRYRRATGVLILADTGGSNGLGHMPGRRNCNRNWPMPSALRLPWLTTLPALPSGTPSSTDSSPPSRSTGPPNRWIPTRKSSISLALQPPKPVSRLLPTSIAATILSVLSLPRTRSPAYAFNDTRSCPTGTTPSPLKCEVVSAWPLSDSFGSDTCNPKLNKAGAALLLSFYFANLCSIFVRTPAA